MNTTYSGLKPLSIVSFRAEPADWRFSVGAFASHGAGRGNARRRGVRAHSLDTATYGRPVPIERQTEQVIFSTKIVIDHLDRAIEELQAHKARLQHELALIAEKETTDEAK